MAVLSSSWQISGKDPMVSLQRLPSLVETNHHNVSISREMSFHLCIQIIWDKSNDPCCIFLKRKILKKKHSAEVFWVYIAPVDRKKIRLTTMWWDESLVKYIMSWTTYEVAQDFFHHFFHQQHHTPKYDYRSTFCDAKLRRRVQLQTGPKSPQCWHCPLSLPVEDGVMGAISKINQPQKMYIWISMQLSLVSTNHCSSFFPSLREVSSGLHKFCCFACVFQ